MNLRINHYFKMKESIMSELGYSLVGVGLFKSICAFLYTKYSTQITLCLVVAWVDLLAMTNIFLIGVVFLVAKTFTHFGVRHFPVQHMKVLAIFN